ADLRTGGEVDGRVDLDLVAGGAGDRVPGELRVEDLCRGIEVGHLRNGRRGPDPAEGRHRRLDAAIALGVDRLNGPVVAAGRERRGDGGRRGGDVWWAGRVVLVRVAEDDRAEQRVARDRDEILGGARDPRPAEDDRVRGEGERGAGSRRLDRRLQVPELGERARGRRRRDRAVGAARA